MNTFQHPSYAFPAIARGHGSRNKKTICSNREACRDSLRKEHYHSPAQHLEDWEKVVNEGRPAYGARREQ